ncbi:peptidoglycan-binding domain-containing protein [Clostridium sp.]
MQILKIGSRGTVVMEIQSLLNKLWYDIGKLDGIYGPKTAAGVQKF